MSRGLGKTEQTIVDYLEGTYHAERGLKSMGVACTTMLRLPFNTHPPDIADLYNDEAGYYFEKARHHSQMQSIRRALRSLERKGIIEAIRFEGDDKRTLSWRLS